MPSGMGRSHDIPLPPTPLQTSLPMTQDWSSTPRAQTRSDLGAFSRPPSSLASILEKDDVQADYSTDDPSGEGSDVSRRADVFFRSTEDEIAALRNALSECWTLCNTLASLSYIHRERIFAFPQSNSSSGASLHLHHQQAWKSCWKLCQNLYDSVSPASMSSSYSSAPSRPTLDLCREFCASLFDARARDNETADSVLRVSFELNNHLFNTHDRSLPEAFRERTLDFYITLCHRLMKQKARIQEESDSLLRACWSLAEMLFSLRQNAREGRRADEELLGSAVQACWELCDLFREGWTQIRPERGTPRPSQTTFTQAYQQARRAGFGVGTDDNGNPINSHSGVAIFGLPETPTTIFEDITTVNIISPDDPAPQPNILVLGAEGPAELGLRSTSSTPAPQPAIVLTNHNQQLLQDQRRFVQVLRRGNPGPGEASHLGLVNSINMGQTPMSAHPAGPNRRFWSSASSAASASAVSASEALHRGGGAFGTRTASTITRATQNSQHMNNHNNPSNPNTRVQRQPAAPSSTRTLTATSISAHNQQQQAQLQKRAVNNTAVGSGEDRPLVLLKLMLVKAAVASNRGFHPNSSDPKQSSLPLFAKSLPDTAFGTQAWQVSLLDNYRKAVLNDPAMRDLDLSRLIAGGSMSNTNSDGKGDDKATLGELAVNVNPVEVALAVRGMTAAVYGFGWLRDLYRFVWGYYVEDALRPKGDGNEEVGVEPVNQSGRRELVGRSFASGVQSRQMPVRKGSGTSTVSQGKQQQQQHAGGRARSVSESDSRDSRDECGGDGGGGGEDSSEGGGS